MVTGSTPNRSLFFWAFLAVILPGAVILPCAHVHADSGLPQGQIQTLSRHQTWHNLLRYEQDSGTESGLLSAIHSPEFFLHPQGAWNPRGELEATLAAFQAPFNEHGQTDPGATSDPPAPDSPPEAHPLCRFPARYLWLKQQLGDTDTLPGQPPACPNYDRWRNHGQVDSISVVYASGYLGNPASFYGHILLKWNSPESPLTGKLDDTSINYGAIIPSGENPVSYVLKGVFGGYEAGFTTNRYYFHNHHYGDNELRDLWEYELALTPGEVALLVAHSWELLGKRYTYYFVKQNCAYRMGEFFNVVGIDLIPDTRFWAFPQAVMQKIANAEHRGRPLVRKVTLHHSRQSALYGKFTQLTTEEHAWVEAAANDIGALDAESWQRLAATSQLRVLETLVDYYQVVRDRSAPPEDPLNLAYKRVLAKRFELPAGKAVFDPAETGHPPHEGRRPSMVNVGVIHNDRLDTALAVTVRPAYYDALDADHGHRANAALGMGDLAFEVDEDGFSLSRLDLVSVRNINALATGLPNDGGSAWNLRVGWEQAHLDCRRCASFRIQGDRGYSVNLATGWLAAGYVGGGLQDDQESQGHWFGRASVELQGALGKDWKMRMNYQWLHHDSGQTRRPFLWQMRYRLDVNLDMRLEYRHDKTDTFKWTFGYYW